MDHNIEWVSAESRHSLAVRALHVHEFGHRHFSAAVRLAVATVASVVPGTGALPEAMALARDRDLAERLRLFDERLADVEASLGTLAAADRYLGSERGREHVISILETAARATSEQQRTAAAHGYFSGCGLGRFDPNTVDILNGTLQSMTEAHMRVFRWIVDTQLGMDLVERRREPLRLESLLLATGSPGAVAQKIVDDLVRAGVVSDCGISTIGGYWGVLNFCLSSFGRAFALYVEEAASFQGAAPPHFESPIPPAPEQHR